MKVSLIWAMDEQGLIGNENRLPWKLPADMSWFREHTLGKAILMGRKTFDSIGKPLPKRDNFILTRQTDLHVDGCTVVNNLDELLLMAAGSPQDEELMVIGGGEIYRLCLLYASKLYVTRIHEAFAGDAWFPEVDWSDWQLSFSEDHAADADNQHAYSFMIYQRITSSPNQ